MITEKRSPKIPNDNAFLASGDGLFFTIQGEGPTIGLPAVFLRLHLCNLKCDWSKKGGEICDAWYTWDTSKEEFWKEHHIIRFSEVFDYMQKHMCRRLVITGGEPLLQKTAIEKFVCACPSDYSIEIETNGTICPDFVLTSSPLVQFNCSPKLLSSDNLRSRAVVGEALQQINSCRNSNFKFVIMSYEDLSEVTFLIEEHSLSRSKIIIMPEGTSSVVLSARLQKIADWVRDKGYRLTPRLQCFIWGNKRGV
jgi:organic radical activating enzyme